MKYRNRVRYNKGPNPHEYELENMLSKMKVEYSRRGYPDYTILKDGKIRGFIEVKPSAEKPLRKGQKIFEEMCIHYGIPFIKWSPEIELPSWVS